MVSTLWMIAELASAISSQYRNNESLTYQRTLFPAPATRVLVYTNAEVLGTTDISHVSIEENFFQIKSIPKRYVLEGTTLRSLCSAIRRQFCDSSMDLAERANFEHFVAICHLSVNPIDSSQQSQH
jgi:hypothetical protein